MREGKKSQNDKRGGKRSAAHQERCRVVAAVYATQIDMKNQVVAVVTNNFLKPEEIKQRNV